MEFYKIQEWKVPKVNYYADCKISLREIATEKLMSY